MFERLNWQNDRIFIGDLVFYLERDKIDFEASDRNGFLLLKPTRLLEQYMSLWQQRPSVKINNVLELGIYDGGSIAFWFELLKPDKYVALDLNDWSDTSYFDKYIATHKLENRVKTFWKTDQSDRKNLRKIVATEFNGPLDLIIDDASHLYTETRASFETLFPLLRPGGLYIIEDWSWGYWPNLPVNFLPAGSELPKLIHQIVDAAGSMQSFLSSEPSNMMLKKLNPLIANINIYADIVVIERGGANLAEETDFNLEDYITFRPPDTYWRRGLIRIRSAASRLAKRYLKTTKK